MLRSDTFALTALLALITALGPVSTDVAAGFAQPSAAAFLGAIVGQLLGVGGAAHLGGFAPRTRLITAARTADR
jgi:hypothetical protein